MRWASLGAVLLASACTDDVNAGESNDSRDTGMSTWSATSGVSSTDPPSPETDASDGSANDTASECGDAVIVVGEQCDGDNVGGKTCASFGWEDAPGGLRCGPDCELDLASCVLCGNGVVDQDNEQCDGDRSVDVQCGDTPGMADGPVHCTDDCQLDFSTCELLCGNGELDPDESCDVPGVASCASLLGEGWQGDYFCFDCEIQSDFCSLCGDEIVGSGEQCDGPVVEYTCTDFFGATATGEVLCDGCEFDVDECQYCGDGEIGGGEICDGGLLGALTCLDLGFVSGELGCAAGCQAYDVSGCNTCGDGVVDDGEACDGDAFARNTTCVDLGFADGEVACTNDCELDATGCGSCGDGLLVAGESCDGLELGGATCLTAVLGGVGGDLACTAGCEFDLGACIVMNPGSVVVTEILYAAAATPATTDGQWIEFYNADAAQSWDLQGCLLESNFGFETINILDPLVIEPGAYATLGTGDLAALFFVPDGPLDASYSLGNTGDVVRLICAGQTIDVVTFDNDAPWPDVEPGTAIALSPATLDAVSNDDGTNWCHASTMLGLDTYGTPGAPNDCP